MENPTIHRFFSFIQQYPKYLKKKITWEAEILPMLIDMLSNCVCKAANLEAPLILGGSLVAGTMHIKVYFMFEQKHRQLLAFLEELSNVYEFLLSASRCGS